MTSITIDTPIVLWKTHFSSIREAVVYIAWFCENDLGDYDWTKETVKNKKAYKNSLQWKEESFSLSDAKILILWNSK